MLRFLVPHLLDDRTRLDIGFGQPLKMALQMLLNLPLGFGQKAKAHPVAHPRGNSADRKRSRVPQRIEQTGASPELGDSLLRPGQMVGLLLCGAYKCFAQCRLGCRQRLRVVHRLRTNLADMVDAHQRRSLTPLALGQWRGALRRQAHSQDWRGWPAGRRPGFAGAVCCGNQLIKRAQSRWFHQCCVNRTKWIACRRRSIEITQARRYSRIGSLGQSTKNTKRARRH